MDRVELLEILCTEYAKRIKQKGWHYNQDLWADEIDRYIIGLNTLETLRDTSENESEVLLYEALIDDIKNELVKYEGVEVRLA